MDIIYLKWFGLTIGVISALVMGASGFTYLTKQGGVSLKSSIITFAVGLLIFTMAITMLETYRFIEMAEITVHTEKEFIEEKS